MTPTAPPIGRPRPTMRGRRKGPAKDQAPKRAAKKRPRLPRTFNRTPPQWLQAITDLPNVNAETMLRIRRDVLNLSRADAARTLRVRNNTIWDWETGTRRPPFSAYLALRCLADSSRRSLLPIDPATDLQAPDAALLVPILEKEAVSGTQGRALQMQARMRAFSSIYNAAWLVRDSWYGPSMRRQQSVWALVNALVRELRQCADFEALLYSLADALTASPQGVPWKDDGERYARRQRKAGEK